MAPSSALAQGIKEMKGLVSGSSEGLMFKGTGYDQFRGKEKGERFREKGKFSERISVGDQGCGAGVDDVEEKQEDGLCTRRGGGQPGWRWRKPEALEAISSF